MSVPHLRPAVGGLVACLVVLAASVGSGSATVRALAGGGCAAADTPHVGLVVDFGDVTSVPGEPTPTVQTICLPYTSGETGADLLSAAGAQLHWGSSGLLCSIDGYPSDECGRNTPGGYEYWSYWHGGPAGWTYATGGPTSYRLSAGSVEGWRFVQGQDSSREGAPRFASSGPCPAPTPTTTALGATTTAPAGQVSSAPPARVSSAVGAAAGAATTSTAADPAPGSTASPSGSAPDPTTSASGVDEAHATGAHRAEALPSHGQIAGRRGPGSPVGAIVVVAVIVGLVAASVLIRRRRSPT